MSKIDSIPEFDSLPQSIQAAFQNIPQHSNYYVALSGGLDSLALLLAAGAYAIKMNASITAVHVHHGLSPNADSWAAHCVAVCEQLGFKCSVHRVEVKEAGEGLEAAARKARYQVFESVLQDGGVLLMGHHLNDQAETFLHRAIKGMGPESLSGMPVERPLSNGLIYRPFLSLQRAELESWLKELQVEWVEDESNSDNRFDRNFIRNEVLPLLESRWPGVVQQLGQSAIKSKVCVDSQVEWLAFHLSIIECRNAFDEAYLDLAKLTDLPELLQTRVVRYWLDRLGVHHPSEKIFQRIWTELIPADKSSMPEVRWGEALLTRYENGLYYRHVHSESAEYAYEVSRESLKDGVNLDCGSYELELGLAEFQSQEQAAKQCDGGFLVRLPFEIDRFCVRSRAGGERILDESSGRLTQLKKWFQESKVPPWWRSAPLILFDDELVFVGAGKIASGYSPQIGDQILTISLKPLA